MSSSAPDEAAPRADLNHSVACHCGAVRGRFRCDPDRIAVWDCNCSDCSMRGNAHFVVPASDFGLDMPAVTFERCTVLYVWGTEAARRRFCRVCGILPWYTPRSNPNGVGITPACASFDPARSAPTICRRSFDGRNWEESYAASAIASESEG